MLVGQEGFKNTVSRTRLQQIHRFMSNYDPEHEQRQKKNSKDPLWYSISLLEHFQTNCMVIAVPLVSVALDKARFRTKARTLAKSYLPSKTDKYAV